MDFDNRKVYGDTSITDGLVFLHILAQLQERKDIYAKKTEQLFIHIIPKNIRMICFLEPDEEKASVYLNSFAAENKNSNQALPFEEQN